MIHFIEYLEYACLRRRGNHQCFGVTFRNHHEKMSWLHLSRFATSPWQRCQTKKRDILPETNILWMVGRWNLVSGPGLFSGAFAVSFRECITSYMLYHIYIYIDNWQCLTLIFVNLPAICDLLISSLFWDDDIWWPRRHPVTPKRCFRWVVALNPSTVELLQAGKKPMG